MDRTFNRSADNDAIAAFLAQGGKVEKVEESASTYADEAARIAGEAGLSARAERRLLWQLRTDRLTVAEAEELHLPEPRYSAEQAAEIRMETFVGARFGGASVDQALDEANHAVRNLR